MSSAIESAEVETRIRKTLCIVLIIHLDNADRIPSRAKRKNVES
jgi:hypothetical protein